MKIEVETELKKILKEILEFDYTEDQWSEIESSDMFQSELYCGGFDGDAKAFYFRYFSESGEQYWFDFRLEDIPDLLSQKTTGLDAELD